MKREKFQELVASALDSLPRHFQKKIENLEIVVEKEPPRHIARPIQSQGGSLLGLYHGVPLKWRGARYANVLPDRITIYQGPLERRCRSEEDLRREVRRCLYHEIGHHFGLSEGEIRRIEEG